MLIKALLHIRGKVVIDMCGGHAAKLHLRLALKDNRDKLTGGRKAVRRANITVASAEALAQEALQIGKEAIMVADVVFGQIVNVDP